MKSETITAMAAIAALLLSTIALFQTSSSIKSAEKALRLSFTPSLALDFATQYNGIYLHNNSLEPCLDVRFYPITYKIQRNPFKILSRNNLSSYYPIADKLAAGDSLKILPEKLLVGPLIEQEPNGSTDIRVVVIMFQREVDSKHFFKLEFFTAAKIGEDTTIFSWHSSAMAGPPLFLVQAMKEIKETESLFFNADL